MDLEKALEQFDATEANLSRIQAIWSEMQGLMPTGIAFLDGGPDGRRYRELTHAYEVIMAALPAIDGFRVGAAPVGLNAIGQMRFEAAELGELSDHVATEEEIGRPGMEIDEYRLRLSRARRDLVRERLSDLVATVDSLVRDLSSRIPIDPEKVDREPVSDPKWDDLKTAVTELERLAGSQIPRTKTWLQMQRHLSWGQRIDLQDIATSDWPTVRNEIQQNLHSELEPVPVATEDLGSLAQSKPTGPVTIALKWSGLSAEDFERLIFNLISDAQGYANPQWLMQTTAPDRGRDLSVDRVRNDELTGSSRERVVIQAKHWPNRSVSVDDLAGVTAQMVLWGHPPVDVLVVATSGRFTADAVDWIETHNSEGTRPRIEMWPESHLEVLLARKPHIAAAFHLR